MLKWSGVALAIVGGGFALFILATGTFSRASGGYLGEVSRINTVFVGCGAVLAVAGAAMAGLGHSLEQRRKARELEDELDGL